MKITSFNLRKKSAESEGEYVLGVKDTGSHACYMIYGIMKPHETGRVIKPGEGHEELVLAVKGSFEISGKFNGLLEEGQAFHIVGDDECFLANERDSEAVYIIAGGHSGKGH